jgi:hypothetical protein
MHVTVVDATGSVGSLIVDELRTRGHVVTAYVRNQAKVRSSWSDDVTVVVGDLSDAGAIDGAVQAPTLSSARSNRASTARTPACRSSKAPATSSPRCTTTASAATSEAAHPVSSTPREKPTWQTRLPTVMAKTLLHRVHDELLGISEIVMTSGLDCTTVRFLAPKDGPARGKVREGFYGHDKLGFNVTRADIAAFTAAQVDSDRYVGAAPTISN